MGKAGSSASATRSIQFVPHRPFAIRAPCASCSLITMPRAELRRRPARSTRCAVGLETALQRVGGLDAEHDWANAVLPGEQHLIAIARLLLTRPRFAFLNQVTEALCPDQVEHVYGVLSERRSPRISIGDKQHLSPITMRSSSSSTMAVAINAGPVVHPDCAVPTPR